MQQAKLEVRNTISRGLKNNDRLKWLIFGDVHGNLPALEQLLLKEKGNYDRILSNGDMVNYGPWSDDCVRLIDQLDAICLRGNHEEYFLEGVYPGQHPVARAFFEFCYPRFSEVKLIGQYGLSYKLPNYKIQHTIVGKYIFADTPVEASALISNTIISHSHQQFERQISDYRLINTGSVGQNREFINVADYLLFDDEKNMVSLRHFIYDIEIVINHMRAVGYSELCLDYYMTKKRA